MLSLYPIGFLFLYVRFCGIACLYVLYDRIVFVINYLHAILDGNVLWFLESNSDDAL